MPPLNTPKLHSQALLTFSKKLKPTGQPSLEQRKGGNGVGGAELGHPKTFLIE